MKYYKGFGVGVIMLLAAGSAVQAKNNMVFVIDSSGSMWGQVGGVTKMSTAKTVLSRLIGDLPPGANIGLLAYGHRQPGSLTFGICQTEKVNGETPMSVDWVKIESAD